MVELASVPVPLLEGAAPVIVEDVYERRHLDAVRRDFVPNVSHEPKTPVAAVGLLAETPTGEEDLTVVRRLVGRMQNEAFRVNHIIDDLLDLSPLEGEPTSGHEPLPVGTVIEEAVEHVRPAADFRGIRSIAEDSASSWTVVGERRQLVSALGTCSRTP